MKEVKLTRQELYDLVWSESMLALSKKYAITDVGLRKKCRKLEIPLPNNGYWAKVQFGKKVVPRILLRNFAGEQVVILKLREEGDENRTTDQMSHAILQNQIENDPRVNLTIPAKLTDPDKLIVSVKDEMLKRDVWHGKDSIIHSPRGELNIRVSPALIKRALLFMDVLIKAFRARGHEINIKNGETLLIVEGEEIQIYCSEKFRVKVQPDVTKSNETQQEPILRFGSKISWHTREWKDGRKPLEEQIVSIIATLEINGRKLKEERIEREKYWEQEREKDRIAKELQDKKEQELYGFIDLLRKARRHDKAEMIRNYTDKLEKSAIARNELTAELKERIEWSRKKADWYDPFIEAEDELMLEIDREKLRLKKRSFYWLDKK